MEIMEDEVLGEAERNMNPWFCLECGDCEALEEAKRDRLES